MISITKTVFNRIALRIIFKISMIFVKCSLAVPRFGPEFISMARQGKPGEQNKYGLSLPGKLSAVFILYCADDDLSFSI